MHIEWQLQASCLIFPSLLPCCVGWAVLKQMGKSCQKYWKRDNVLCFQMGLLVIVSCFASHYFSLTLSLIIFLGAYHSSRTEERIFLKQRKGFVRIAIENQVPIIPVYCFGHTQLFDVYPTTSSWIVSLSRKVTKFRNLF